MKETVVFAADNLDDAYLFQQVLSSLEVEVAAGSAAQLKRLMAQHSSCSLVVYSVRNGVSTDVSQIEPLLVEYGAALLVVLDESQLDEYRPSAQLRSDFVVHGAGITECKARVCQLLWPAGDTLSSDLLVVDNMTINLATYQVLVGGSPIDLTYLEYALLSFLASHPGRTYSRDALLRRVWGFDYYGGSRTVDVHVRRIRAKLGPELAQHLETVRGVGYLWDA